MEQSKTIFVYFITPPPPPPPPQKKKKKKNIVALAGKYKKCNNE